jgi:hypothetical protein
MVVLISANMIQGAPAEHRLFVRTPKITMEGDQKTFLKMCSTKNTTAPSLSLLQFVVYARGHHSRPRSARVCRTVTIAKDRGGTSGSWISEMQFDRLLEAIENIDINSEIWVQMTPDLALHLLDLPRREHALSDNGPWSAAVGAVTGDFDSRHEGGDEETVAACGQSVRCLALKEKQRGKDNRGREFGAVERRGNKVGKLCFTVGGRFGAFIIMQVVDKASTEAGCVFMPIERV